MAEMTQLVKDEKFRIGLAGTLIGGCVVGLVMHAADTHEKSIDIGAERTELAAASIEAAAADGYTVETATMTDYEGLVDLKIQIGKLCTVGNVQAEIVSGNTASNDFNGTEIMDVTNYQVLGENGAYYHLPEPGDVIVNPVDGGGLVTNDERCTELGNIGFPDGTFTDYR